ncbi:hypothetical protein P7C73_g6727, partial [Tremellales sp. Uapishka_1]
MDVASLFNVKDKVVLVTGGGRGVGEMVYISSRDAKACQSTADRLTSLGPGRCIALPGDLAHFDACVALVAEIEKREGKLNVLINNSGATWGDALETYPDQAFTKLLNLNVQRVFTLIQKAVPLLQKGAKQDGVGRIIN